ncbi:integrase family protein [Stenotrophomonas sp. MMGLT7]|uniref:tyrosine-type recombinase/integrase n=1 Tax=Stenotrophomonas sp. MMGLT7 TaxID=2901227 RepID=UPI001E54710B|nr:integrase family protein [Stenotrophomonas sp. MMGLT7]MCD7097188.1 integrase family protein [Stenotrophomonas sp. MMGLT7]
MAKLHFTDAAIRALPPSAGANRIDYAENDVRGFAIQTTYTGAKRFLLVYVAKATGRERRLVLGEFGPAPKLSVSAARKLAAEKRAMVDLGRDPWLEAKETRAKAEEQAERQAASFGNLLGAYVEYLKAGGKASWRDVERAIERHITPRKKLAGKPAEGISVDDVMPVFHALAKEGKLREAEKLRAYVRAAYTAARKARNDATLYAFSGFRIHANPLLDLDVSRPKDAVEKAAAAAKERKWALSEAQLQAYWRRIAADETTTGALLRLHLLTGGQRVEQLARATTSDYDRDAKTLTLRDTKGRRAVAHEHIVPLLPDAQKALAALQGDAGAFLVSLDGGAAPVSYHKAWEALQAVSRQMRKAGEVDRLFTPGTIRKTVETRLAAKGVSDEVLARLLSHGLGGLQARHYNAHRYDEEKRAALKKLRALCEQPKGKVIPFKKSG